MDFIVENYLWFGIAGVVLLMALIGFLAEKTDFITGEVAKSEKPKKQKMKKQNKEDKEFEQLEDEDFELASSKQENNSASDVLDFTNTSMNDSEPTIKAAPLSLDDPWMQPDPVETEENEQVNVVTDSGEDLTQPFGDQEVTPVVDKPVEDETETVTSDEDVWKF